MSTQSFAHSIYSSSMVTTCAKLPIERRKIILAKLLGRAPPAGIVLNVHYEADGAAVFKNACALGCEGIVSKRLGSTYRSGRTDQWLKIKNPVAPAARREAEEDGRDAPASHRGAVSPLPA